MIKRIVKQNKGFINVYSEPGQGTTFRIYLPRHEENDTGERQQENEKPTTGRGETILVAEDEVSILALAEKLLTKLNYKVLTASTPLDALKKAEAHSEEIALLITDVIMPGMNGLELAQHIETLYPEIRCLFMSGYTADVIADKGVLPKNIAFIQKPFSYQDMAAKVRSVLDSNKA